MSAEQRKITSPLIDPETEEYWNAIDDGKLLVRTCKACSKAHHYPRTICPNCGSDDTHFIEASGKGVIYTYSVMRRAPEEAVAEAMYWRSYPDPPPDRSRRFWSMLFQWRLSQVVTQSLAARVGDDIAEFSFNALIDGDEAEQTRLGAAFDMERNAISDAFAFTPPFRYRSGDGFCGPDSMWRNLLTDDELANIAAAASGNMWRRDLRALLAIAPAFPMLARNLGDFTMYPGTFTVRRVNAFRQLAADTAAGVRLTLGVQA